MNPQGRAWPWLVIGIALILAGAFAWILTQDRAFKRQTDEDLQLSTSVARAAINVEALGRLQARPEDAERPEYHRLREQLRALTEVLSVRGLRGLYTMRIEGREVRFIVDSAPVDDPWHSEPGTVYEEVSESTYAAFSDGRPNLNGPETDEYGTFYSSLHPIIEPDGSIRTVLGADIEASYYDRALWARRIPVAVVALLLIAAYATAWVIITQRHQKLRIVQHYTRRLEVLIDQMPVGVLILEGADGYPTLANEAALALFGRDIDTSKGFTEFVGTYAIVSEDGSPYPKDELPIAETLSHGKQASGTGMFIRRGDGSKVAFRMASVPIRDQHDKIVAVVVVLEDMTPEYELDRQKREFISIASHELKAPLTGIRWNTDLLLDPKEKPLNESQKGYVENIVAINARLSELVNHLLDVSRLEAGRVVAEPALTDLNALVDGALREAVRPVEAKKLKLYHDRQALPEVVTDARLVRQVLANLVSNAVKYTPEGGRIAIGVGIVGPDVRFAVTDTGIGIPKMQQPQMFRKFFRTSNASASGIDGTGLGLYISQQAVRLLGGRIGFSSEEGKGSTFWFTLPIDGMPLPPNGPEDKKS